MAAEEAQVRAVNAEPWEPLPGMVKLRCEDCRYWFASHGAAVCPDCARFGTRPHRTLRAG